MFLVVTLTSWAVSAPIKEDLDGAGHSYSVTIVHNYAPDSNQQVMQLWLNLLLRAWLAQNPNTVQALLANNSVSHRSEDDEVEEQHLAIDPRKLS